jgi:hypothetical protein
MIHRFRHTFIATQASLQTTPNRCVEVSQRPELPFYCAPGYFNIVLIDLLWTLASCYYCVSQRIAYHLLYVWCWVSFGFYYGHFWTVSLFYHSCLVYMHLRPHTEAGRASVAPEVASQQRQPETRAKQRLTGTLAGSASPTETDLACI